MEKEKGLTTETSTVLVVDDDAEIAYAVSKLLQNEGYNTIKASNGLEALDKLITDKVDLIILDIMMPKLDGLSATMKIRERENIPIIILSAKSEDSDKILGLSIGADDYVTKPYNPEELLARVRSQLRRYKILGSGKVNDSRNIISVGSLTLDTAAKSLTVDGVKVKLTPTEYNILHFLMLNKNHVFSAEQIYSAVWNQDSFGTDNTVMVHIRRIREKIEINPREPKYLKVVWGLGYKIEG
ncbi:MAG: response regulator transcription factor [Clostridia bacterium]|nr:response regulator transcription factor [Clostridia bacterium]